MNKFIFKIFIFVIIILTTYIFLGFLADGYTDPFYLRFTSGKQNSLILGSSKAAQGILPEKLNLKISKSILNEDIYNYAFTVNHSPFGKLYFKSIKEKLNTQTKNGLFIITVDPWAISKSNKINHMRETELEIGKLTFFNSNPNYDYLLNSYKSSMFNLIRLKYSKNKNLFLHKSGWLEVDISLSDSDLKRGIKEKILVYKNKIKNYKISDIRLSYLEKTISLLSKHGKVILVRMPIHNDMLIIENEFDVGFNERMEVLKRKYDIPYLVYQDENYIFPDGNHLYKDSGKQFSEKLANDINKLFE